MINLMGSKKHYAEKEALKLSKIKIKVLYIELNINILTHTVQLTYQTSF